MPGTNHQVETDLVGWFDILGYEGMLENPDLSDAVAVIREVIAKVEPGGYERIESIIACLPSGMEEEGSAGREAKSSTRWIVFADTIVLATSLPQRGSLRKSVIRIAAFLELAKNLHVEFLGRGLPLRGAIAYGHFYAHESLALFAGRPLLDAHRCAEAQQWSGCVFTPTAESVFQQTVDNVPDDVRDALRGDAVRYAVSFKNRRSGSCDARQSLCLNWPKSIGGFAKDEPLPEFVQRQFARYGKCISEPDVQEKIRNTVAFMTHAMHML